MKQCGNSQKRFCAKSVQFSCLVRLGFIIITEIIPWDAASCVLCWFIDIANMLTNIFWGHHITDNYHFLCVRLTIDRSKIKRFLFPWIKTHKFICIYLYISEYTRSQDLDLVIFFRIVFVDTYPLAKYLQIHRLQPCYSFFYLSFSVLFELDPTHH